MQAQTHATTVFLSATDMVRLVRRVGLSACIAGVAERIEREFLRWHEFDKSARVAAYSERGVIELMPIADASRFAFKYVNGHPGNHLIGLPSVMAFGALADVDTGAPRFLSELTLTTAIRTAAMSALATRQLARADSRSMAIIGNGAQSEFQAITFRDLVGVRELRLFDVDRGASDKLAANLSGQGFDLRVCASAADAVRGADIVTTLTADKARATILTARMIEPGMHVNAVGGDSPGKTELEADVLQTASVFVEFEPQSRIEGEIQQMPADFSVTEFWQVLAGTHPGRRTASEVTVFDSVGFALEDFAALSFMRECAERQGLGTVVALVPQMDDPKNLYALLREPASNGADGSVRAPAPADC
ncbi:MAG: ornithine cyclodeaminase [Gammaproteobacteria bacterium]|nr:ornithine cyclodeaminase [Gammaproteobacteria bacterium]